MAIEYWPVVGQVEGGKATVTPNWPLPEGASVEGWAFERTEPRLPDGPLTADEASRLLGDDVVVACARRGIDVRELDWNGWFTEGFSSLTWYRVIPTLDEEDPWPIWLPLFAHLLRLVEIAPREADGHMGDVQVVTTGLFERDRESGTLPSNARLTALLALRIVELCLESGRIGPHDLFEIQSKTHTILQACIEAEERFRDTP